MRAYTAIRAVKIARYIIKTGDTVRKAAAKFRLAKSAVYKDVAERLPEIEPGLAERVRRVLDENKSQRHIRGGQTIKERWKRK
jgi:putative DeoR family transcriptional regulator (stage III sporulation protein D)